MNCSNGDVRLYQNYTFRDEDNGFESLSGYIELCVDGQFLPICNETSVDIPDIVDRACKLINYNGLL